VEFTLPIRNLIYNVSLGGYLPYVVNRDREALPQGHLEQQIVYPGFSLTLVWVAVIGSFKLEAQNYCGELGHL